MEGEGWRGGVRRWRDGGVEGWRVRVESEGWRGGGRRGGGVERNGGWRNGGEGWKGGGMEGWRGGG